MAGTFVFPDDVPTLTDGVVTLRAHAVSDVDGAVEQCVDPETTAWTTVPYPYTRDDAVAYLTKIVPAGWVEHREWCFAIEAAHADGTRRFAGSVSLRLQGEGLAEIAYGLHPGARRRGVCGRAVKLLLDWGFQQPDVDIVIWHAYVGNWGSRRVAWANGFSIDGTVTKFLSQRGERRDSWIGTLRPGDGREPKTPWHVPPVLETERLRLRPLRESDSKRLGELLADERTRAFMGRSLAIEQADGAAFVLHKLEADARGERVNWCIADPETDQPIGHVQLFNLAGLDTTSADVGYGVHPDARGRGVLTDALNLVVEWAFRPESAGGFGKRRLSLRTAGSNAASRHAAERTGFVHVATEPEVFPVGDSGFEDSVTYHRLNPHWSGSRRP